MLFVVYIMVRIALQERYLYNPCTSEVLDIGKYTDYSFRYFLSACKVNPMTRVGFPCVVV